MQIVNTVAQRNLGERQTHTDPIGGQMVDVIQINPAYREVTQLFNGRRGLDVRKDGRLWFESEWNEAGEAAGLVLELSKLPQMIDSLRQRLDMAVEHGT